MSDAQSAPAEATPAAAAPAAPEPAAAPPTSETSAPAPTTATPTIFTPAALPPGNTPNPLSKNQQKKLARQAKFAATRELWKQQKKEKEKAKKARKREEARLKRAHSPDVAADSSAKKPKPNADAAKKTVEDITLIVDLGFDELMTDKEIVSLSSQLTRCYSANRAAAKQFRFCVSGLGGRLLERYEKAINSQHKNWRGVEWVDQYEVTEQDRTEDGGLVYLTADSPNTITELEPGKRYVIGGIVDRNRHKFLCYNKAKEQGIKHGKLPIGDYIKMASRQVLTTNQVVEIMISWLETRDWEKAFLEVIPQRKMASLKGKAGKNEEGEKEDDDEEDEKEEGEKGDREEETAEEGKTEEGKEEGREQTEGEALAEKMDVDAPAAPADEAAVQKEISAEATAV